jgi:hypothetical protein
MARLASRSIVVIGLACGAAFAQTPPVPTEFPSGATPLESNVLQQRLSGKVFRVATASGTVWRWQLQDSGYFFLNVGNFADSGKWRTEGSALCTQPQKSAASCNEMRLVGDTLYLKRDSGEIIKLEPQ